MWASVIWCVLSAQLSWCAAAAKKATHIIRFLDAEGVEHYGHAEEGVDVGLAAAGGGLTAELIDGDIFGSLHRTGVRADVVKLLAPVPMPPVIYGIGAQPTMWPRPRTRRHIFPSGHNHTNAWT
jgi:hypothetical protein